MILRYLPIHLAFKEVILHPAASCWESRCKALEGHVLVRCFRRAWRRVAPSAFRVGKPWGNRGKPLGKPWENHEEMGKPWEKPWKMLVVGLEMMVKKP